MTSGDSPTAALGADVAPGTRQRSRMLVAVTVGTVLIAAVGALVVIGHRTPETSKPAAEIAGDARSSLVRLHSVHERGLVIAGRQLTAFDMHISGDGNGRGTFTFGAGGPQAEVIYVGHEYYVRGRAFFASQLGTTPKQLALEARIGDQWVAVPTTPGSDHSLLDVFSLPKTADGFPGSAAARGKPSTVNGRAVIAVSDPRGTLYVATEGTPFPIRMHQADGLEVDFDQFNEPVSVVAPSGALHMSELVTP